MGLCQRGVGAQLTVLIVDVNEDLKYATGPHNNHIPGLESTIHLHIKDQSQYLTLQWKIKEDMSQEEVTNVISGDIYFFNFNRSENYDSNEKKRGGLCQREVGAQSTVLIVDVAQT